MPEPDLRPATPEDLADALAFALRYSGRKQVRDRARSWRASWRIGAWSIWSDRASSL